MRYIDPHIHVSSRTTDDYQRMRKAGIVAVVEPAFWMGQPRTSVGTFQDYFSSLVGWERFRASQFGIRHYCTIGLNSKEANNEPLAEEVMEILPLFLGKQGVVAVGEIGYDDQSDAEDKYFRLQIELGKKFEKPILVHTPHRAKKEGTLRSMDVLEEHDVPPHMASIDHNNEETVKEVLDRGYWAGFTIYPDTKMGKERMAKVVQQFGSERIIVNSSADWGVSNPLSVPDCAAVMRENGIDEADITLVTYQNAIDSYAASGEFNPSDWEEAFTYDQADLLEGNSVLRGQTPKSGNSQVPS